MNPTRLPYLSIEAREVLLDSLLETLPSWLELVSSKGLAPRFRDARSGEPWRLFPGGEVELGVTPLLVEQVEQLLMRHPLRSSPLTTHFEARTVSVEPFLMMEQVISHPATPGEPRVLLTNHVAEAKRLLQTYEARLPTEPEWEYAWRLVQYEAGGWVPAPCELCAEAWSLDGVAVEGPPGVVRSASFDREEFDWVLPARQPLKGVRFATIRPTRSLAQSA